MVVYGVSRDHRDAPLITDFAESIFPLTQVSFGKKKDRHRVTSSRFVSDRQASFVQKILRYLIGIQSLGSSLALSIQTERTDDEPSVSERQTDNRFIRYTRLNKY